MNIIKNSDKILGTLYGGAIGDSLGVPHEGNGNIKFMEPDKFVYSDDTQLTLATCEAIIANKGYPKPEIIADKLSFWFKKRKISGIGASTYKALKELSFGAHWALAGAKGEMSAGNGAAMRIAPLVFIIDIDNEKDRVIFKDTCRITHQNEESYIGALALAKTIQLAYKNELSENLLFQLIEFLPDSRIRDRIIELSNEDINESLIYIADKYGNSGYAVESIPFSIYSSLKILNIDYSILMKELIETGGDADTNGSMFSQIAGSYLGLNALPNNWVNKLKLNDELVTIINNFINII